MNSYTNENENIVDIIYLLKQSFIDISNKIRNNSNFYLSENINNLNISGDNIKVLDIFSHNTIKENLKKTLKTYGIISEENENIEILNNNGKYIISFDPLDGSSNIDVNITVGTIFCVFKLDEENKINSGRDIICAGYCLYGSSTQLIIADSIVSSYILMNGEFRLDKNNLVIPNESNIYSINESNKHRWNDSRYINYVENCISSNKTQRWVASLVADAHRTLIKGGFFSYPSDSKNTKGRIRLTYEAYAMAYIFEKANGVGSTGNIAILDIPFPYYNIHIKTPILLSSIKEYNTFLCNY